MVQRALYTLFFLIIYTACATLPQNQADDPLKRNLASDLVCADLFSPDGQATQQTEANEKTESPTSGFLSFFKGSKREKFNRLYKTDPRLANLMLVSKSKSLDLLDNVTSPATEQLLFKKIGVLPKVARDLIQSKVQELTGNLNLSLHEKNYLTLFIVKSIIAHRIIREIMKASNIKFSRDEISAHFAQVFESSLDEINDSNFQDFNLIRLKTAFSKNDFEQKFKVFIKNLSFALSDTKFTLNDDILSDVGSRQYSSYAELYDQVTHTLEQQLSELPVGISYRILELTSTIRFGNQHFYSGYFLYDETSRGAYERDAGNKGGLLEVTLNIPNYNKKKLAIILDRGHRSLDSIFNLEKSAGTFFFTCGAYAPVALWRAGVPIITPAIITPATTILSLGLQRALGFTFIKNFSFSKYDQSPVSLLSVPAFVIHELFPTAIEMTFYIGVLTNTGRILLMNI
jgi:hypothetical protein